MFGWFDARLYIEGRSRYPILRLPRGNAPLFPVSDHCEDRFTVQQARRLPAWNERTKKVSPPGKH